MSNGAKWIWKNGVNDENTWINFAKKFCIRNAPKKAAVKIAVDSKYWMYINGELTVFEGGLKRGPDLHSTYYDEFDIAKYLKQGENTIAIIVWFFGKNGFSHLSSGMGGLLFEADIDGQCIVSDNRWSVKRNPAYVTADISDDKPNFRHCEANIYFDANKAIDGWLSPDFDISDWDMADEICSKGYGVWGDLKRRSIPMLKNYGLKNYVNSIDFKEYTTTEDTVLNMKLPYNAQITPYLNITSDKGKKIIIKTDTFDTSVAEEKNHMAVYYTKDGVQEYESYGWINGETVSYVIPEGVVIHSLKYRETGYDTEFDGRFHCDDEFLNILWQKSLRTLYVTMRDNFMDCPDRERAQWWGDVNIEMQMLMYSLSKSALCLYRKGVDTLAGWAKDYGYMPTVSPAGNQIFELPFQNLAGIWGFSYYYEYTGDMSVIVNSYKMSKDYLLSYMLRDDGLVEHKKGSWDWADWGENEDILPLENAWYFMALKSVMKMAKLLNKDEDITVFNKILCGIKKEYNSTFLKNGCYYCKTSNSKPDDRANAMAVLSGLASQENYSTIAEILNTTYNSSPYMEKYVLDALCEMGYTDYAMSRMKLRYKEMVEYDYSTLWEYWSKDGTLNHAWSGGPLITMSKYIAGIKPIEAGYKSFEIKPYLSNLKHIECIVPSIKGDIELYIQKTEDKTSMQVVIPEDTTAFVYLPLDDNKYVNGNDLEYVKENNYARFVLAEGTYTLIAEKNYANF